MYSNLRHVSTVSLVDSIYQGFIQALTDLHLPEVKTQSFKAKSKIVIKIV